jgi:hypothetical protein
LSRLEQRFCLLRGTFAPTVGEGVLAGVTVVCVLALIVAGFFWIYHQDPDHMRQSTNRALAMLAVLAVPVSILLLIVVRRVTRTYEFNGQTIRCRWHNGRVLWEEPLESVQNVFASNLALPAYLTVCWQGRRRRVFLCKALRKALTSGTTSLRELST